MNIFKQIYNEDVFLHFLSVVLSIVLTVTIIYIKREIERNNRLNYYKGLNADKKILGDINIKIDEELPRKSYLTLMTMWGIQPILLLVLLSLTNAQYSYLKICLFFALLIFTLFHEFTTGLKLSDNYRYQLFMLLVWMIAFFILSYVKNLVNVS